MPVITTVNPNVGESEGVNDTVTRTINVQSDASANLHLLVNLSSEAVPTASQVVSGGLVATSTTTNDFTVPDLQDTANYTAYAVAAEAGSYQQVKGFEGYPSPWPNQDHKKSEFGSVIAFSLDGTRMAVGSPSRDDGYIGENIGSVSVFHKSNGSWSQLGSEVFSNSHSSNRSRERFGGSVSIDGDWLVVGSVFAGSPQNAGTVWLFEWDSASWSWPNRIVINGASGANHLGQNVSIVGSRVAAVASGFDDHPLTDVGCVRVWDVTSGGSKTEVGTHPIKGEFDDEKVYECALSPDGQRVAVGSFGYKPAGSTQRYGRTRIYRLVGGNWQIMDSPIVGTAPTEAWSHVNSGKFLAFNGTRVCIGEPHSTSPGFVRVFEWTGYGWSPVGQTLQPTNVSEVDMTSDGSKIIIGTHYYAKKALVYQFGGITWDLVEEVADPVYESSGMSTFGISVAIHGDTIAVGNTDFGYGSNGRSRGRVDILEFQQQMSGVTTQSFITSDFTDPVVTVTPGAVGMTQADVTVTSTEAGTAYFLVQPSGNAAPTAAAQVKASALPSAAITAAGITHSLTGLAAGTEHTLYVVVEDSAVDLSGNPKPNPSIIQSVTFTTVPDELEDSITDATARAGVHTAVEAGEASDAPAMFAAAVAVPNIGADSMAAYKDIVRLVLAKAAPGDNDTAEINRSDAAVIISTVMGAMPAAITKIRCVRPLRAGVNTGVTLTTTEAADTAVQMVLDAAGTSSAVTNLDLGATTLRWRVTKDAGAGTYTVEKDDGTGFIAEAGSFTAGDTTTSDVGGYRATITFNDPLVVVTPVVGSSAGDPFIMPML